MTAEVAGLIRERLQTVLNPTRIHVRDDSHLHAGHAGAREGGHYHVVIASEAFRGLAPLARHRRVYEALGELMPSRIHALFIVASLPDNPAP
jgi:BolA family transcriptional regulator, general stress-responsive regulator